MDVLLRIATLGGGTTNTSDKCELRVFQKIPGYLLLKCVIDANAAKALTLSISMVSLKLAMMALVVKYRLQML